MLGVTVPNTTYLLSRNCNTCGFLQARKDSEASTCMTQQPFAGRSWLPALLIPQRVWLSSSFRKRGRGHINEVTAGRRQESHFNTKCISGSTKRFRNQFIAQRFWFKDLRNKSRSVLMFNYNKYKINYSRVLKFCSEQPCRYQQ